MKHVITITVGTDKSVEHPVLKTWYVGKGVVTDLESHDSWGGAPVQLGDDEWQFSDGPCGQRTWSHDYLSLEQGLRDLSPAIFIMEDE